MNLSQSVLETPIPSPVSSESLPAVSSGNLLVKNDPLYLKDEVTLALPQQPSLVFRHGFDYAQGQQWGVALNMQQALQARTQGMKMLSPREADLAARKKLDLSNALICKGMLDGLNFLTEDIVGLKDNVFQLRFTYNWCLQYKKTEDYKTIPQERKDKGERVMADILLKLEERQTPAWPEEITEGFPLEYCRPEYMTDDQYQGLSKKVAILLQSSEVA